MSLQLHILFMGIAGRPVGRSSIFVEYFFFCCLATVHTDMYAKVSNSFIALGTVENFMCAIRVGED